MVSYRFITISKSHGNMKENKSLESISLDVQK